MFQRLTVQSWTSTVALVEQLSSLQRDSLGLSYLVWVQFAVTTQEEGVVDFFCGSGVVQPLLQPV